MKPNPIINCHAHIFTGDYVPPLLAKKFIPAPLYYLIPVSLVVRIFRIWYKYTYDWQFESQYKRVKRIKVILFNIKMIISRNGILSLIYLIIELLLSIQVFYILYDWISKFGGEPSSLGLIMLKLRKGLDSYSLIVIPKSLFNKFLIILVLVLFFKAGRNIVFFILKKIWSFLGLLPGPKSKELAARYLYIGRYAFYKGQNRIFSRLKDQYPEGTGFILLPMDMKYMDAGKLKKDCYYKQIEDLRKIKVKEGDTIFPFIFADPRRFVDNVEIDKREIDYFKYSIKDGKVKLDDCFIKHYIEDSHFSGIKIYPALGYYPFDEALLPLWKYTADNQIPIITHCCRGTIFYRGKKLKEWDKHPVFKQEFSNGYLEPLSLLETKNIDFINNFTHPLNYLCLLDERLLRILVEKANDKRIQELFGYTNENTELKNNLNHLKLCFAHYGGDDEWNKFLEHDRDNYSSQIIKHPSKGISFLINDQGNFSWDKLEQIWKYVDWYSIISSLMLQYPNIYADLSYILHNPAIQPLLKMTLLNGELKNKVLFGTDFYVVRNHKSDKNLYADMIDNLTVQEFDQIARINPREFLNN
jgi:predicted TIM-barrel fold metal-dependent hydrolase